MPQNGKALVLEYVMKNNKKKVKHVVKDLPFIISFPLACLKITEAPCIKSDREVHPRFENIGDSGFGFLLLDSEGTRFQPVWTHCCWNASLIRTG